VKFQERSVTFDDIMEQQEETQEEESPLLRNIRNRTEDDERIETVENS
jgi:hypothetical protein